MLFKSLCAIGFKMQVIREDQGPYICPVVYPDRATLGFSSRKRCLVSGVKMSQRASLEMLNSMRQETRLAT